MTRKTWRRRSSAFRFDGSWLHRSCPHRSGPSLTDPVVRSDRGGNRVLPKAGRRLDSQGHVAPQAVSTGRTLAHESRDGSLHHARRRKNSAGPVTPASAGVAVAGPAGAVCRRGYFEVIGRESGKPYRVFPGGLANVCEVDERGRPRLGLCFRTLGELPIGDVILAQKIALERAPRAASSPWPGDLS
jgi:hypothetical protein